MNVFDWSKLYGIPFQTEVGNISTTLNKPNKTVEDRKKIYKHYNFEELARLVVDKTIKNKSNAWKQTPWTDDNNHDGYTVISYYSDGTASEEWWLEAKYSYSNYANITRYRLDATIVSAILSTSFISRIIFVTNLNIKPKTVDNIRKALEKSTNCKKVDFFTKDILEFFLFENKEIIKEYFDLLDIEILNFRNTSLFFLLSNANIYSKLTQNLLFKESENEVFLDDIYSAEFGVFSSKKQKVILLGFCEYITIANSKTIKLNKGFNYINIDFFINKHPNNKLDFLFRLDNQLIKANAALKISAKPFLYEFKTQQKILNSISHSFAKDAASYHIVIGNSGSGKTTLIDQVISNFNNVIFYTIFGNYNFDNFKSLIKIIKFILFPFIPAEYLDYEYLNSLNRSENLSLVSWLSFVEKGISEDNINSVIEMCSSFDYDFPQLLKQKRFVFLDNAHLLSDTANDFLLNLISKFIECKLPIHIVLIGQNNNFFYNEQIRTFGFILHECKIFNEDYEKNIKKYTSLSDDVNLEFKQELFTNIIELNEYLLFLKDNNYIVENLQTFISSYMGFAQSEYVNKYIIEKFNKARKNAQYKEILDKIYFSSIKTKYHSVNGYFDDLLDMHLIKIDHFSGEIACFHDVYKHIYVSTYDRPKEYSEQSLNEDRNIDDLINASIDLQKKRNIASKINEMRYNKFGAVLYILESVFINLENKKLKRELGAEIYYNLLFTYGYACANCSSIVSGKDVFVKIYEEIKSTTNLNLRLLLLEVLSEIINSCYDGMLYKKTESYINEFEIALDRIIKYTTFYLRRDDCRFYCLVEHIKLFLNTNLGKNTERHFLHLKSKSKSSNEYACLLWRYAHCLYTIDIEKAYIYTLEAKKIANEEKNEKLIKILDFQYDYLTLIRDKNFNLMDALENKLRALKDDLKTQYIKNSFALAAIYYMNGDVEKGNNLFFIHIKNKRKFRKRLLGFFYQNIALIEINNKNYSNAIKSLEQCKECFSEVKLYIDYLNHNIEVLGKGILSNERIRFLTSGELDPHTFYVDPRIDS